MKASLFLPILLFALNSCSRDSIVLDPATHSAVSVELPVRSDRMIAMSRSADEETLRDLNFYLYDGNGEVLLHRYQTSPTLHFEYLPGNYSVRIAANWGRDMGENPAQNGFTVTHADNYEVVPMVWEGDIAITPSAGDALTLPTVEVSRCVAKLSYQIDVEPSDIELRSVQLLSVPRTVAAFDAAAAPPDNPADYTDCTERDCSGRQAAGSYYLLPNPQGQVTAITDQRDKNCDNAPSNASYLLIRAVQSDEVLAYTVYLGENNTSDFNVRANTHYRFDISILGDSEIDTRVSSYTLRVHDTYEDNMIGGYCTYDIMGAVYIDVEGNPAPLTLQGHITALQGDMERLLVDDASIGSGQYLHLANQLGRNEYFLYYDFPVYTAASSQVTYTVTVEDDGGYTQSFTFERRFANRLNVVVGTPDNGNGRVKVSGALYDDEASNTHNHVVLCHEFGCTLMAIPLAGYRFEGWYSTDGYTKCLSPSMTYFYKPETTDAAIFPKFAPATSPLDDKGTANCYIAPELGMSYSFDATVQGNGKPTTNVWPIRLTGTSPRVLWKTGSKSKNVISEVSYADGRITFTTGTQYGNAVIGLFDSRDECIWSWHIWVADYDIEATAQTYASGAVFMDRNLGALTTDCMLPKDRGLYYQWGRKDPFVYPASCQDRYKLGEAVYAAEFKYAESYPNDAEALYDVMTVEWSIAHPTTYMNGATYQDWEEWTSVADWLYDPRPNLWGNKTTNDNNISRISQKSIYAPCPPGWKVPSAEDFPGIDRVNVSPPYYATIHYNGNRTTRIPLGGTFSEGYYMNNGQIARLYTNAPYHYRWESGPSNFYDIACTSIYISTGSTPPYVGTTDYYRYAANPIRCVKE